jgi:hypothetical protein
MPGNYLVKVVLKDVGEDVWDFENMIELEDTLRVFSKLNILQEATLTSWPNTDDEAGKLFGKHWSIKNKTWE